MRSKKITRTRHYCEHCGRGMWTRSKMVAHEVGCTANPNRSCGLCRSAIPELEQKPISQLIACIDVKKDDLGLSELRKLADGCPACILAAIRQSEIQKWDGDPECPPPVVPFNFKDEYEAFWATVNNTLFEQEVRSEMRWG